MAETVYLSQRDVRELQFAKAAISTGWTLLLEELGVEPRDVQQVLLAGSFGSYLSPASAVRIGLVPKLPVLRIVCAGNVAGEGAKMALLSLRERAGAATLLEEVRYVELSDRADFNDRFVDQLAFPELTPCVALIACGAIAQPCAEAWPARLAGRRAPAAAAAAQPAPADRRRGRAAGRASCCPRTTVAVGYADCGTYGALDEVCTGWGSHRLAGLHCYDVYAGAERIARCFESSPAPTCSPTSWSARSRRTVVQRARAGPASRSCATTTSATTPGWSGWPRSRTTELRRAGRGGGASIGLPLTVRRDRALRPRAGVGPVAASVLRRLRRRHRAGRAVVAPALGLGDLVEGEDVQAPTPSRRVGERLRAFARGTTRGSNPPGAASRVNTRLVLGQEPCRVTDSDPGGHASSLVRSTGPGSPRGRASAHHACAAGGPSS